MTIEIKNIDTYYLIKGIIAAIVENNSAESHDEFEMILKNQMNETPECDAVGNILDDPVDKYAKVREAWNKLYRQIVGDSKLPDNLESALSTLDTSVGCTVEEVCYAGYAVIKEADSKIRHVSPDLYTKIQDWILTCVSYYENNWRTD